MTVNLSLLAGAGWQFFDNNGSPLSGGKLYTYAAGTTTPQTSYTSNSGTTPNANPIILNAAGRLNGSGEIWLTEGVNYKFVLTDSNDVLLGTYDNIVGANDGASIYAALANSSDPAKGDALIGFRQSNSSGNLPNSVGRTVHQKLQEIVSVEDFGAVGDGVTDDTAPFAAAVSASSQNTLFVPSGNYPLTNGTLAAGGTIVGAGAQNTTLTRTGTGTFITAADRNGDRISGLTLNLDQTTLGNVSGHGISASGNGLVFKDIVVKDYGSDGVGGGTGILVTSTTANPFPENIRMVDCDFRPNPAAAITIGWLFGDVLYSFASRISADSVVGGIGYAHELKDNARYNSLSQLIATDSNVALAYGQTTVGTDGADYNVATNIVAARCDQGLLIGEGFGNITVGMVHLTTNSPANAPRRGVSFTGSARENYAGSVMTLGPMDESVYISGDRNTVEIVAHDTGSVVAAFTSGSDKNFVNVVHSGSRTSVRGNITDNSGFAINSAQANVVHSPLTGERIGSVQGKFWDKLGEAGVTPPSSHNWVHEADQFVFMSLLTQGNEGDISGISVSTARDGANEGRWWHVTGSTEADNYWTLAVGGVTGVLRIYNTGIRNGGENGPRWLQGEGSPEGVVSAPVGSFFSRTNGGPGTSFYVKESGTGNTGWAAK